MDTVNATSGNVGSEALRAHIVKRFLPNLGSGMKLFDAPMTPAGNSVIRAQAGHGGFSAVA